MNSRPVFCIAEIGTSHQGDLSKAKELILAAKESKANAVKFQIVFADEILSPFAGNVQVQEREISIFQTLQKTECSSDFYTEIAYFCQKEEIEFLATPFGLKSAALLQTLKPKRVKIASPEINHFPLLNEVKNWECEEWILSSGVSLLGDIERAILLFKEREKLSLLHCVTRYPAQPEEYNLNILPHLQSIFGVNVGVSDHTKDPLLVPIISTALGSTTLEKHFTLSHQGGGVDDPIALVPDDFSLMVSEVLQTKKILFQREEERTLYLQERIGEMLGREEGARKVSQILGDGIKRLTPHEIEHYHSTNRTIHALNNIERGEKFSTSNLGLLRAEESPQKGLPSQLLPNLLGARATKRIESGRGVVWSDILQSDSF